MRFIGAYDGALSPHPYISACFHSSRGTWK
jgi:hypothetical protein